MRKDKKKSKETAMLTERIIESVKNNTVNLSQIAEINNGYKPMTMKKNLFEKKFYGAQQIKGTIKKLKARRASKHKQYNIVSNPSTMQYEIQQSQTITTGGQSLEKHKKSVRFDGINFEEKVKDVLDV